MTHAVVLVIVKNPSKRLPLEYESTLEMMMEPYYEGNEFMFGEEYSLEEAKKLMKEHNEACRENAIQKKYDDVNEFMKHYGFSKEGDYWGYYYNPNAEWDWWVLGGRWAGFLEVKTPRRGILANHRYDYPKPDTYVDGARKKDLTEECLNKLVTYAVLDKDGWYEKGHLGLFGMSDYSDVLILDRIPYVVLLKEIRSSSYLKDKIDGVIKELYNSGHREGKDFIFDKIPKSWFLEATVRNYGWKDKFREIFIDPLDDNDWLFIVDYHI